MGQETARMTRLVNDLLMLTRYESRAETNRQPIVLDAWLNETLNEINPGGRGATESRSLESGLAVDADPEALKQVVQKQKRRKIYQPGELDVRAVKPKGAFRIFTNYRLFAIIGAAGFADLGAR